MISSTPALQDCLQHARTHGAVAIDTEFVWDETYYPGLGLVQLGISPDAAWLIDAPALADPAPVGALLADPGIIKVLHDARQDLCILKDWSGGAPRTIFDTRLAAGFCGYSSQLSLQALLREVLGVELEKSETRTNWLRRPLSARQIAYALDDVRHMLELRDRLLALAGEAGTLAWLKEEMQGLDDPALYQARPPAETWARVKDAGRLNAQGLAVLCELAALREETLCGAELKYLAAGLFEAALAALESMIYKEEHILFPMALGLFAESEWGEIWSQSQDYGWCLVAPAQGYAAPRASFPEAPLVLPAAKAVQFPSGTLSFEQLLGLFNNLPVDLTFVDAEDRVGFFSEGPDRVFARSRAIIGRSVQNCHPPKSMATVERILADFKAGRQSVSEFWIEMGGKFVHIRYFAVRDEAGAYLGTLEVTQDLTRLRALTGERRLLQYDSAPEA